MTNRNPDLDNPTDRQIRAASPDDHVWVSANAGSGKTRVLINRVARLLLEDTPPQNVLCLTYTKAAASEMQNRLFDQLGRWAMLSDGLLQKELNDLGVEDDLGVARLAQARRLFARAIEAPGGLRIQTIHAFCASLLRRFPLEAGISPQFQEMDERAAELLLQSVMDTLSETRPDLVAPVALRHTGEGFERFLGEIARTDGFGEALDQTTLGRALGARPGVTVEALLEEGLPPDIGDIVARAVALFRTGSPNDVKAGTALAGFNMAGPVTRAEFDLLCGVLLTGASARAPFSAKVGSVPTKETRERDLGLIDRLNSLMRAVEELRPRILAQETFDRTVALHRFGQVLFRDYSTAKATNGLLDFDDLIKRALRLLNDPVVAQWVLFKLDGGIDHILVDEAQDTSPEQWIVIRRLTEEFATGYGARSEIRRTLFVVGDKKQSIYSFQGADPDAFDAMREHFDTAFRRADDKLVAQPLSHSFRSSSAVLNVVDETFKGPAAEGVEEAMSHTAFKADMPGRVELWPVVDGDGDRPETPPWFTPLDRPAPTDPKVQLAEAIAGRIKEMIAQKVMIPIERDDDGTWLGRAVTEGDFLILVRRRSGVFPHLIRACKSAGLNIAGADRLRVGGELAVRDIAALLRFLALPEDDLSLAEALRSPLLGWDEQALFTLAHHRPKGQHLWEALRGQSEAHPELLAMLNDLRRQADFLRPFDLIDRILHRWGGMDRLLARLGEESEDGIEALLSQALSYEQTEVPSLTGFLSWMQTDNPDIKRQPDAAGDRLQVMTVHGAKGLERPIVILPDCNVPRETIRDDIIDLDGVPIWKPSAKDGTPPPVLEALNAMKDRGRQEWRRLLYVAMTRAQSWLIVAAAGKVGTDGDSWYGLTEAALTRLNTRQVDTPTGQGRKFETGDWAALTNLDPTDQQAPAPLDLPAFGAVRAIPGAKTLSPSDLGGAKVLPGEPAGDLNVEEAKLRGTLLHRLLEHLPTHRPEDRLDIARQLAETSGGGLTEAEALQLAQDALTVIDAAHLKHIFAPGTLSEVALSAVIAGKHCAGAIDRLIVEDDRVLAIDYKSNRLIPKTADEVPEGLLRQMGAYAAMLRQIYPNRRVETAILWTGAAQLMPLPEELVSAALDRVSLP